MTSNSIPDIYLKKYKTEFEKIRELLCSRFCLKPPNLNTGVYVSLN